MDFSTNDYLGLSRDPHVRQAACEAACDYGMGATGSRLLSGNVPLFQKFEDRIAEDKKTEAALLFSTGFQANAGVLSALLDQKILGTKPLVFFDRLNHASLYQAIFLAQPTLIRYLHNDMNHLSDLLREHAQDPRPKFIVTETVFGMDGDLVPLKDIVHLAHTHGAFLYLDEAHATGVYGPSGYGLSTTVDLRGLPCVIMGTFSKALGCSGAYIACAHPVREYLMNKVSGFIYSTAPSPAVIGGAFNAWTRLPDFSQERAYLTSLGAFLRKELTEEGQDIGTSTSFIVPVILKEEQKTLHVQQMLKERDILVSAIRPPTVPPHSSRLRLALTLHHQEDHIRYFVKNLTQILKDLPCDDSF